MAVCSEAYGEMQNLYQQEKAKNEKLRMAASQYGLLSGGLVYDPADGHGASNKFFGSGEERRAATILAETIDA